jgi:hypothetical protein
MTEPNARRAMEDRVIAGEIAALREAVDNLANRAALAPRYREPDGIWLDRGPGARRWPEWNVARAHDDASRFEWRVRSGHDDGLTTVFLVDRYGDMHAMSIPDAHRLIEALTAAVLHANDELTARRARRQA